MIQPVTQTQRTPPVPPAPPPLKEELRAIRHELEALCHPAGSLKPDPES